MLDERRKHRPLDLALLITLGLNLITAVYWYGELNRSVQDLGARLNRVETLIDQRTVFITPPKR